MARESAKQRETVREGEKEGDRECGMWRVALVVWAKLPVKR